MSLTSAAVGGNYALRIARHLQKKLRPPSGSSRADYDRRDVAAAADQGRRTLAPPHGREDPGFRLTTNGSATPRSGIHLLACQLLTQPENPVQKTHSVLPSQVVNRDNHRQYDQ